MIPLKSEHDLEQMRICGRILSTVMDRLRESLKTGITTSEIDGEAEKMVLQEGALPAFKGYRGFPASVCISINEEIVHGIPGQRRLEDGDVVSLDLGVNYRGYFTDGAITVILGRSDGRTKRLVEVTKKALEEGIRFACAGRRLSDISHAVQQFVEKNGFSVVRDYVGHGIGLNLHEEPEIPNYGRPNEGPLLKAGMVLAIEPMVNMGTWESRLLENGWTAVTKDGLCSAHFEHTVAITQDGPQILTRAG